jgi:hypothetical protein
MKLRGMLALFTASLVAGELLEVADVSKEAVAGSREVTHVYGEHREVLHLQAPPLLVSKDVAKVSAGDEPKSVKVELTAEAAKKFAKDTAGMEGKRFAVLVQGKVMSVPMVRTAPLGGTFVISGFKDEAEVKGFVDGGFVGDVRFFGGFRGVTTAPTVGGAGRVVKRSGDVWRSARSRKGAAHCTTSSR